MCDLRGYADEQDGRPFAVWFETLDAVASSKLPFRSPGERLLIPLGGGTKKRQDNDIKTARERWENHRQRRKREIQ
ncbi:MAG: hypothetical protein FJW39_14265 [Acidobacteria bacterium]|nr:hypothetical protein [Acidobacteriota bacterium]